MNKLILLFVPLLTGLSAHAADFSDRKILVTPLEVQGPMRMSREKWVTSSECAVGLGYYFQVTLKADFKFTGLDGSVRTHHQVINRGTSCMEVGNGKTLRKFSPDQVIEIDLREIAESRRDLYCHHSLCTVSISAITDFEYQVDGMLLEKSEGSLSPDELATFLNDGQKEILMHNEKHPDEHYRFQAEIR